jgi:hypothetical protein
MIPWSQRTLEERRLLNPAFCAQLVWRAARGHINAGNTPLSLEEVFLVPPMVLHGEIRKSLPRDTRTSLAVWLETEPLARRWITAGARRLVPFTKEALLFGGVHGFIEFAGSQVRAVESQWAKAEARLTNAASDEVRDCAKRAEFVGKWFAQTGSAPTVLALLGVRP